MKHLAARLLLVAPLVIVIGAVNGIVDPAGLFHASHEREVARLLRAGKNAAVNVDGIDQRLVQRYYIESLTTPPNSIVLGSSRAMFVRQRMMPNRSFFNHAMFGATLEDLIAILGVYEGHAMLPGQIVLAIDPWVMSAVDDVPRWRSIADSYERLARASAISIDHCPAAIHVARTASKSLIELFSPGYFQASLRALVYERNRSSAPVPVDDDEPGDRPKLLRDGSLQFERWRHDRTVVQIGDEIQSRREGMQSLGTLDSTDDQRRAALTHLIGYLAARGVDVSLLLIPYHPLEYRRMREWPGYSIAPQVESHVRRIAANERVSVAGSYDPAVSGCEASDFFDSTHARPSCIARVLEPLNRVDARLSRSR